MSQLLKRRLHQLIQAIKPTIIVGVFFAVLVLLMRLLSPVYHFVKENDITPAFMMSLWKNPGAYFQSFQGRTNILVLGIAGGAYDGADLTDSMLLLSIDFGNKNVAMVSIPRDIWLDSLKDKVNTAYHYGQEKKKGGGLALAKAAVEEVVGVPISYALMLDFDGFKDLTDEVGGVNVNVAEGFVDDSYPIAGKENDLCGGDSTYACRYEKLQFTPGIEHMDGTRALKYARSRYASGDAGTDFARGKRQQEVIIAFKKKIIQSSLWKNPGKLKNLLDLLNKMVVTDMSWPQKILFFKFFAQMKDQNTVHIGLDWGDDPNHTNGLLINPPAWQYNDVWVLIPRDENFKQIHEYIQCRLYNTQCTTTKP